MSRIIQKYLQKYAEPIASQPLEMLLQRSFKEVAVMPAYRESVAACQRFIAQFSASHLLILVVNQPDTDQDKVPQQELVDALMQQAQWIKKQDRLTWVVSDIEQAAILIVDAYSVPLSAKSGVGLARKIGADIAVQLYVQGVIETPWVGSIDADTYLPQDYFSYHLQDSKKAALIYDIEHIGQDNPLYTATKHYEKYLYAYVEGLKRAGSPYAFLTLGSALAFHIEAYCKVRGFPKRAAGEDFYLINKLIKVGDVVAVHDSKIFIEARHSQRVPFGTAVAAENINAMERITDYKFYHPKVFVALKNVLDWFRQLVSEPELWTEGSSSIEPESWSALCALGFDTMMPKLLQQSVKEKQVKHQIFIWFDAFRTLKFIHFLTDHRYPKQPLR